MLGDLLENFSKMHVSEDKACWKDSCWFVGRTFTLISLKDSKDDVARSQGIQGNIGDPNSKSWFESWAWGVTGLPMGN